MYSRGCCPTLGSVAAFVYVHVRHKRARMGGIEHRDELFFCFLTRTPVFTGDNRNMLGEMSLFVCQQHRLRSVGGGVGGVLFVVLRMRSSLAHVGVSLARLMKGPVTDAVSRRTYPCHCFG